MESTRLSVRGDKTIDLVIGRWWVHWAVINGADDVAEEVARSLSKPISADHLAQKVAPGLRVAIVVDDSVANSLEDSAGCAGRIGPCWVERNCLTVVPALGVHRAMDDAEITQRLGENLIPGLSWGKSRM
jgi:nickel-dependent lactate racemase